MKTFLLLAATLFLFSFVKAQESRGKVSVSILKQQATGIEDATVELHNAKDSSLVRTALTDKAGLAEFEKLQFGKYILKITAVGYRSVYSSFKTTPHLYCRRYHLLLSAMN